MADDPAALRALGRQVAEQQGYDPNDPTIDFVKYGKDAQYRIGKGQSVSPVDKFRIGHQQRRVAGHATPRSASRVAAPADLEAPPAGRRTVRVGAFEIGYHELSRAANRPQRTTRRSERTTGRFRMSAYADPGYQRDGKPRYLIDTPSHVRAAWAYINRPAYARRYSAEQRRLIHARIQAAGRRFGIEFGHARTRAASTERRRAGYPRPGKALRFDARYGTVLEPVTILAKVGARSYRVRYRDGEERTTDREYVSTGNARTRAPAAKSGNHSHPAHPYSHPITTKHRRR